MSIITFGKELPEAAAKVSGPDWIQANPRWIERALERSQARDNGGWMVVDGSRMFTERPKRYTVAGRELVAFRPRSGEIVIGPDRCPHMGASLADGRVEGGTVVCPWHGLRLGCESRGSWQPLPTHDDGVLVWARFDEPGIKATQAPLVSPRPALAIDAVVRMEARCDPADVIANRMDPWHGAHYHPYSFARLRVIDIAEDEITVRVAKRVAGPLCVEVDARFHSPTAGCIVMTIVAGEGMGSVVETHATPIEPGRTAVIEANIASSDRKSFAFARRFSRVVRPLMERSARRLWVDDCAYAERLYANRQRRETSARGSLTVIK